MFGNFRRFFYQTEMAGMQVAHGGYQGDALTLSAPLRHLPAQLGDGAHQLHAQKLCSGPGNSPALTAAT